MITKEEALKQIKDLQEYVDKLPDDDVWPSEGDKYHYVMDFNKGCSFSYWKNSEGGNKRKKQGNIFKTQEGAELKAKQNEVLQQMREIADSEGVFDWGSRGYKFFCYRMDGRWITGSHLQNRTLGATYFPTRELAQRAIDELDLGCLLEVAR